MPPAPVREPGPPLSFVLTGVSIAGATVFTAEQFGDSYREFLARTVTAAELQIIATRITRKYIDAGYFISRAVVPEQRVEGGILRLQVTEGYVEKVRFLGDGSRFDLLAGYGPAMTRDRPARLDRVERSLLLINALPGFDVRNVELAPIGDNGPHELVIRVDYDSAEAVANFDNRGTPEVGRLQTVLSLAANSIAELGEQARFTAATVPNAAKELLYGQFSYEQPLGHAGTVLRASVAGSRIDAGGDLARQDTEAASLRIEATARHPLVLSRRLSLHLHGWLEYIELEEERFEQTNFDDSLRVFRLRGDFAAQDGWGGANFLTVEASQGFDVLGASEEEDPDLSRADGDGTFTKFRFDAVRRQEIWGPIDLRLAAEAQIALDPLLSFEEFNLGGSRFGRAFDFGELSGEDGVAGSIELRYGKKTTLGILDDYQVYGFYDIGAVWNRNAGDKVSRDTLASVGGGLRLGFLQGVGASLELAKPLNREVDSTNDNDLRAFFSLMARF